MTGGTEIIKFRFAISERNQITSIRVYAENGEFLDIECNDVGGTRQLEELSRKKDWEVLPKKGGAVEVIRKYLDNHPASGEPSTDNTSTENLSL